VSGPIVAIDGPAGAGKTTVATALARRLGLPHVDTGAMYRAITLKALRTGTPTDDGASLERLCERTEIGLAAGRVLVDGEDVTTEIRSAAVTAAVSSVSAFPGLRRWMVVHQRRLVAEEGAVVEGRDIGTVVLPDADLKIYLTASPEQRAERRAAELQAAGGERTADDILTEILVRDRRDSGREASPLSLAPDAVVVDSTDCSVDEVVDRILELVQEHGRRSWKGIT
jgi:cytidylate kinase